MKVSLPKNVGHDLGGFAALADLWAHTANCAFTQIELDLSAVTWLDADMCAPLGALLHALGQRINMIQILNLRPDVERALAQNGFLSFYGGKTAPDRWGTALPYQRFDPKDDRYFADYVRSKVLQRSELPAMTEGLVKKLSESLFEIFSNAATCRLSPTPVTGAGTVGKALPSCSISRFLARSSTSRSTRPMTNPTC